MFEYIKKKKFFYILLYMSMTKYEVRQNIKFYILSRQNIICQDKIWFFDDKIWFVNDKI